MTQMMTAFVEAPVASWDNFYSTQRGVVSGNALEKDYWDSSLTAEITSIELWTKWSERDNGALDVAISFTPDGMIYVDFGPYAEPEDGQWREATVKYTLTDSSGQSSDGFDTFTEDPGYIAPPPEYVNPVLMADDFTSFSRGVVSGNVLANDFWDSALTATLTAVEMGYAIDERDGSAVSPTISWTPDGMIYVDFGEYVGADIGQRRYASFNYTVTDSSGQIQDSKGTYSIDGGNAYAMFYEDPEQVFPDAVDDEFTSTERGIVTGNALTNDTWSPVLTASITSAEVLSTYNESDGSTFPVTLTFDAVTGVVTADFGPYVGTDTGLSRTAVVDYTLSDSAGYANGAEITFIEYGTPDQTPEPVVFDTPYAIQDDFADPVAHTVSGNLIANDVFDSRLTATVTDARIVLARVNFVDGPDVPAAWSFAFDPDGFASVYFGEDRTDLNGAEAIVEYTLTDSEGQQSTVRSYFIYGVTTTIEKCTSTTDIPWSTLLEFVDPGDATSWSDFFVVGEVQKYDGSDLTFELLPNGSLKVTDTFEDTEQNDCAFGLFVTYGAEFFSNLIAGVPTPPADTTPPVVDEPAPKVVNDPLPKIPNAGASADTSSPASSLAILAIILLASGGLVMASPGKK